jgi:hypothetical protein
MFKRKNIFNILLLCFVILFISSKVVFAEIVPSERPLGIYQKANIKTEFEKLSMQGVGDILLIQTGPPWNTTSNEIVLPQIGKTYYKVDMSQINTSLIEGYQVVLIVSDQVQSFYNFYQTNYQTFYDYVNSGGTLLFFSCFSGWQEGILNADLPGGVHVNGFDSGSWYLSDDEIILSSHPIVTGELGDNVTINNNDLDSTCSQTSFGYFSNLPTDAKIIFAKKGSNGQEPTMIEYKIGKGTILASLNPWEYFYQYEGQANACQGHFGYKALDDVFRYAFSVAGGHQISGVNLRNIYPEDNWLENSRPITYKHPGDLVDIVAVVTNTTGQEQTGITLKIEVPEADFDKNFLHVFKRASAEEIATRGADKNYEYEEITSNIQKNINGNTWVITVSGLNIPTEITQKWNDFIFRLKLKDVPDINYCKNIDATATVSGNNIVSSYRSLSAYKSQIALTGLGKIFLTNRVGMYRQFARNADNSLNTDGVSKVHTLWETMNKIAGEQGGVIYNVDRYDNYSTKPTASWLNDRKNISYDNYPETNEEENTINFVAKLVDTMLELFIDNSGGIGKGRYVVIIGDDSIIPFYRVWDPTTTVLDTKGNHNVTAVTQKDANNNYLFTDIIYRDYDSNDWRDGKVENIFVGRIIGRDPEKMSKFLLSSNKSKSSSNKIVKLENWKRNGELKVYEDNSIAFGYEVVKDVDSTTIDFDCTTTCAWWDLICKLSCDVDDPATWDNAFSKLFKGTAGNIQDFDVFRGMAHGDMNGIYSSEPHYSTYFCEDDLSNSASNIADNFAKFYPFFIYDACLVGLTDETKNTFMNAWAPLNARGVLASTAVTWTPNISDFNDIFYKELLLADAGKGLNRADNDYNDFLSFCGSKCSYTKFEMNLFGVPWAKITPPKSRSINAAQSLETEKSVNTSKIRRVMASGLVKNLSIDASNYNVVTTTDNYNLVLINGFDLLMQDSQTPVIPIQTYNVDLPLNATVDNINVTFGSQQSLGQINIPAFVPPPPMPELGADPGGYVPSPTNIGTFPSSQSSYHVSTHDNKVRVIVTVYPVTFNSATQQATIYKSINISVNYSTPNNGIVTSFNTNKSTYSVGETIETYTTIENTSPGTVNYQIAIDIRDSLNNIVASTSGSIAVNSNYSKTGKVNISAPAIPGNYKVLATVSDGQNQIGSAEQMIKVVNAQIEYFNIPVSIQTGHYGTFEIGLRNLANATVTAFVDFYIYKGQHRVAKLPQITDANLTLNEMRDIQTQWYPPSDLEHGDYAVQAVVTINETTISSELKSFLITSPNAISLNSGWNLISLPLQPSDHSIDDLLSSLQGIFTIVWSYQDGAWKMYDPFNPGFSDLTSMEIGYGYWIKMNGTGAINISGNAAPSAINLASGWNLVGYNSTSSKSAVDAIAGINDKVEIIWSYQNGAWKLYDPANPGFSDLGMLEPGRGYWIKTKQACSWTLP